MSNELNFLTSETATKAMDDWSCIENQLDDWSCIENHLDDWSCIETA